MVAGNENMGNGAESKLYRVGKGGRVDTKLRLEQDVVRLVMALVSVSEWIWSKWWHGVKVRWGIVQMWVSASMWSPLLMC